MQIFNPKNPFKITALKPKFLFFKFDQLTGNRRWDYLWREKKGLEEGYRNAWVGIDIIISRPSHISADGVHRQSYIYHFAQVKLYTLADRLSVWLIDFRWGLDDGLSTEWKDASTDWESNSQLEASMLKPTLIGQTIR